MGNSTRNENIVLAERFIRGLTWWYANSNNQEIDTDTWTKAADELGKMQKQLTEAGATEAMFEKAKSYIRQVTELSYLSITPFPDNPSYYKNMRKVCFEDLWVE